MHVAEKTIAEREAVSALVAQGMSRLQAWREVRGISVRELADAVDAPVSLVVTLEVRCRPLVADARRAFAKALRIAPPDLA